MTQNSVNSFMHYPDNDEKGKKNTKLVNVFLSQKSNISNGICHKTVGNYIYYSFYIIMLHWVVKYFYPCIFTKIILYHNKVFLRYEEAAKAFTL